MRAGRSSSDQPALDRPWRRPGRWRYCRERVRGAIKPPVTVYEPVPGSVRVERDLPVAVRDGTVLRVNVFRPPDDEPHPVIMCAHPYGKDRFPVRRRRGYRLDKQFRLLRQTGPIRFSSLTTWEAPDPMWWVERGYAVVNCDLRGAGTSDGVAGFLSDQEGEDVHDLAEWAGAQRWSSGAVGMLGVSYLAISQWKAAALRPPHLKAICPWEGFTDVYRDLLRPGGIREDGFAKLWSRGTRKVRQRYLLRDVQLAHPLRDEIWRALAPRLADIEVPALVCGSFSDNNLHSRGSFRGFEQISSQERFLFTHRDGKWAAFYSEGAKAAQLAFFERFLRDLSTTPTPPRVRLEVRGSRDVVTAVRDETAWPPSDVEWTPLFFTGEGLSAQPSSGTGSMTFDTRRRGVRIGWTLPADIETVGPMSARLWVEVHHSDDVALFVGVEKLRRGRHVPFEGSYGFGRDRVATGWARASLRDRSFKRREPLRRGEVVAVDVELGPSATSWHAGDRLQLVVAGRWLWPRNPMTGQFPAAYEDSSAGRCTIHWSREHDSKLSAPVIRRSG